MEVSKTGHQHCAGFEKVGTIIIKYQFKSGVQGPQHRLPGEPYQGTSRTCYLPDNRQGNEVLVFLEIMF